MSSDVANISLTMNILPDLAVEVGIPDRATAGRLAPYPLRYAVEIAEGRKPSGRCAAERGPFKVRPDGLRRSATKRTGRMAFRVAYFHNHSRNIG